MELVRPMIEVKDLGKSYGDVKAVDGISFTINRGEVVGFLGPNGAGKTTTMKVLTTFIAATHGEARIDGLDVEEHALEVRRKVGYLPESAPLYGDMMVLDYLGFVADVRGFNSAEAHGRIKHVAEQCAIGDVLGKDIGQLSKGYRRRVALAQALLHEPECLILDEPTEGLDPNQIIEIRELIKQIGAERTILLSSHILPEVQATCSRVLIINKGRIVADGTTDSLTATDRAAARLYIKVELPGGDTGDLAATRDRFKQKLAALPHVRGALDAEGEGGRVAGFEVRVEGGHDPRREIFQLVVKEGALLVEMRREVVSLEDVFRRLTAS